jgi:hypothetical protein
LAIRIEPMMVIDKPKTVIIAGVIPTAARPFPIGIRNRVIRGRIFMSIMKSRN